MLFGLYPNQELDFSCIYPFAAASSEACFSNVLNPSVKRKSIVERELAVNGRVCSSRNFLTLLSLLIESQLGPKDHGSRR